MNGKMLERHIKTLEKSIEKDKKKIADYLARGNQEVARIHAETSIKKNSDILSYTKLAANIESMASYVQMAMDTNKVRYLSLKS